MHLTNRIRKSDSLGPVLAELFDLILQLVDGVLRLLLHLADGRLAAVGLLLQGALHALQFRLALLVDLDLQQTIIENKGYVAVISACSAYDSGAQKVQEGKSTCASSRRTDRLFRAHSLQHVPVPEWRHRLHPDARPAHPARAAARTCA